MTVDEGVHFEPDMDVLLFVDVGVASRATVVETLQALFRYAQERHVQLWSQGYEGNRWVGPVNKLMDGGTVTFPMPRNGISPSTMPTDIIHQKAQAWSCLPEVGRHLGLLLVAREALMVGRPVLNGRMVPCDWLLLREADGSTQPAHTERSVRKVQHLAMAVHEAQTLLSRVEVLRLQDTLKETLEGKHLPEAPRKRL